MDSNTTSRGLSPGWPLAFALLVAAACASRAGRPASTIEPVVPTRIVPPDANVIARVHADSLRHPYTDADVEFMTGMISHHSQAITMSRMAPTHGASAAVQRLASRIINAQTDEILTMQQWLADRRLPVPAAIPGPMRMTMDGMEHEMLMPGMLTPAQMQQLDQARGAEFDRLFLTFMIQHHTGAIQMVRQLFGSYGAGQDEVVFKFASDVNVDQTTEVARMQQMLSSLSSTSTQRN
ncbi:MAG TPA: DUF305 domain-containing protein [Gemmatimonadaceae bacterium]|nr:DUF305 domain-containing protein [Gemmatimonadaceae bacterium]